MKLTKQRLIELIKEEYQSILSEKTVRLPSMDINFRGDTAQLHVVKTLKYNLSFDMKKDVKWYLSNMKRYLPGIYKDWVKN